MSCPVEMPTGATIVRVERPATSGSTKNKVYFVDKIPTVDKYTGQMVYDSSDTRPCPGGRTRSYSKVNSRTLAGVEELVLDKIQICHGEKHFTDIDFVQDANENLIERSVVDRYWQPRGNGCESFYSNYRQTSQTLHLSARQYSLNDKSGVYETFNEDSGFISTRKVTDYLTGRVSETSFRRGLVESHTETKDFFGPDGSWQYAYTAVCHYNDIKCPDLLEVSSVCVPENCIVICPVNISKRGSLSFYKYEQSTSMRARSHNFFDEENGPVRETIQYYNVQRHDVLSSKEKHNVTNLVLDGIADPLHPEEYELEMLGLHFGGKRVIMMQFSDAIKDHIRDLPLYAERVTGPGTTQMVKLTK